MRVADKKRQPQETSSGGRIYSEEQIYSDPGLQSTYVPHTVTES
jgi:hypothetical protein